MNNLKSFIREHTPLATLIAALAGIYLLSSGFAELTYGALRLASVLFVAFTLVFICFPGTIRKFIHSGDFETQFNGLAGEKKLWLSVGVIALIVWAATTCFSHAGTMEQMQEQRWKEAQIRPEKVHFVRSTVAQIERNKGRYLAVSSKTGVPWKVIASLHNMECGLSFSEHLHNGDPLYARTRHVPAGRPLHGNPPFPWEYSAVDALLFDHLDGAEWKTIGLSLQSMEAYNGTGYQRFHPDTPTPYLWSWTTIYTRGKYVEDGKWDPYAMSNQCGVASILKLL